MSPEQTFIAIINSSENSDFNQDIFPINTIDFDRAEQHGVVTLLEQKLSHLQKYTESEKITNQDLGNKLKDFARLSAANEMHIALARNIALKALENYHPILLKGTVMANQYYAKPYHRPMGDVDILIENDSVESIRSILLSNRFTLESSNFGDKVLRQFSCIKALDNEINLHFDIHTQLFNRPGLHNLLSYQELKKYSVRLNLGGQIVLVPSAAHCAIHACVHLMAHHANSRRLIWLYDIKLILESFTDEDKEYFLDFVEINKIARIALSAIEACHRQFPLKNQEIFSSLVRLDKSQQGDFHPATNFLLDSSQVKILLGDWSQTHGMRNRIKWLREHLFPHPPYIQEQFNVRSTPMIIAFYIWRILRGSVKLFTRNR